MTLPVLPREVGLQFRQINSVEDIVLQLQLIASNIHSLFLYLERARSQLFDEVATAIKSDPITIITLLSSILMDTSTIDLTFIESPTSLYADLKDLSVSTIKLASKSVTLDKIQDIATGVLLGRASVGSGSLEQIGLGSDLSFLTNALRVLAYTGDVTKDAGGTILTLASPIPVTKGGTGTTTQFTSGSILFADSSGIYAQDNDNLHWDNINKRLGILIEVPTATLHVRGSSTSAYTTRYQGNAADTYNALTSTSGTGEYGIWNDAFYFQALDTLSNGVRFFGNSSSVYQLTITAAGIVKFIVGGSSNYCTAIGLANVQISASGIGNAADTTDDTLFTYTLALNSMFVNGQSIHAIASGHFATNANLKQVKFWFAGTAIADSGALTLSNIDWVCEIHVTRIDATHVSCIGKFIGSNVAPVITVTPNLTISDLTANNSVVKITGASTVIGAANDVVGYQMKVEFAN